MSQWAFEAQWHRLHQRAFSKEDIDAMYADFLPLQKKILDQYTDLIAGVADVVQSLRAMGLQIGSSTGYTRELMEVVSPAAKRQGYQIGSWMLEKASTPGSPSGVGTRLKFFTGTHWCIIQTDEKTGVIVFQHGGRYEVEDNALITTRDFAGESTKIMLGSSARFVIKIKGDVMEQFDSEGVYNET